MSFFVFEFSHVLLLITLFIAAFNYFASFRFWLACLLKIDGYTYSRNLALAIVFFFLFNVFETCLLATPRSSLIAILCSYFNLALTICFALFCFKVIYQSQLAKSSTFIDNLTFYLILAISLAILMGIFSLMARMLNKIHDFFHSLSENNVE
ncbi:MAG: hypothetical protein CVV04_11920 [Firmicutes bacterium HGW-Firmicutes-9]|nr:MAG: hypothetical protein CVV04_11920 [Firmicutes bacterium HGW-Firmicutes-9]